jgi:TPR repeat protein
MLALQDIYGMDTRDELMEENNRQTEAIRLWKEAALLQEPSALVALGNAYFRGDAALKPQVELAEGYYRKAAELGNIPACYNLGQLLWQQGQRDEARQWLEKGAEAGDTSSMLMLSKVLIALSNSTSATSITPSSSSSSSSSSSNHDSTASATPETEAISVLRKLLTALEQPGNKLSSSAREELGAASFQLSQLLRHQRQRQRRQDCQKERVEEEEEKEEEEEEVRHPICISACLGQEGWMINTNCGYGII